VITMSNAIDAINGLYARCNELFVDYCDRFRVAHSAFIAQQQEVEILKVEVADLKKQVALLMNGPAHSITTGYIWNGTKFDQNIN